ncbi:hypothetical protein DFP72DRAFT_843242 [Ephemerocybe angulata]|uniref:Uncharacterized protein n=1 Tax=Ephemerocybe angulata TaxID=980116 RepID=A0A8H6I9E7_9AGAR|nr:hypothetical protein DFP72DRAFT_843242 [Tulosesus angulatus]
MLETLEESAGHNMVAFEHTARTWTPESTEPGMRQQLGGGTLYRMIATKFKNVHGLIARCSWFQWPGLHNPSSMWFHLFLCAIIFTPKLKHPSQRHAVRSPLVPDSLPAPLRMGSIPMVDQETAEPATSTYASHSGSYLRFQGIFLWELIQVDGMADEMEPGIGELSLVGQARKG